MTIPILHGTAGGPFLLAWNPALGPMLMIVMLAAGYVASIQIVVRRGSQPPPRWRIACFTGGIAALIVAMLGPLDTFNDELFTLHMLQHMVLMQVAAPLLLLGQPIQYALRALPSARGEKLVGALHRRYDQRPSLYALTPLAVMFIFNGVTVAWHFPVMYEAALTNDQVHWLMHGTFFLAGLVFWRELLDPVGRTRLAKVTWSIAILVFSMLVGKILGAILTFADGVIYPFYSSADRPWGLDVMTDQQTAGTIMLVGNGVLYVVVGLWIVARALIEDEREDVQQLRQQEGGPVAPASIATGAGD